ncbi:MAG: hypothetical protein MJZ46_07245, partial [Bacteroidales bacterium]|nr:hypothetical protein [Bacteroidales bacterium]
IKSYEGGYKIFILWMAERLYRDAAPKLLKTLEEPESNTLFILITENSDKILSTILSRTQLVKIPKISTETIQKQLQKDFNLDEPKAKDIALVADGDYNQALRLLNSESDHHQLLEQVDQILGSIIALSRNNLAQVEYMDIQNCFKNIIDQGREYQKTFMNSFIRILRNMLMKDFPVCKCSSEEQNIIGKYAPMFNLKNVSQVFEECNKAQYHIERNGNSTLILTDWYLKVAALIAPNP